MNLQLKGCYRCGGDLRWFVDRYGEGWHCLNCGLYVDEFDDRGNKLRKSQDLVAERNAEKRGTSGKAYHQTVIYAKWANELDEIVGVYNDR